MEIRYTDGPDEFDVTPAGKARFTARRGEWVEVDDAAVAKALLAQGWESRKPTTKKEN